MCRVRGKKMSLEEVVYVILIEHLKHPLNMEVKWHFSQMTTQYNVMCTLEFSGHITAGKGSDRSTRLSSKL